jgi:hypothetical protein
LGRFFITRSAQNQGDSVVVVDIFCRVVLRLAKYLCIKIIVYIFAELSKG